MGFFSKTTNTVQNRMADIGDSIQNNATRASSNVSGFFAGNSAYASARDSVQSFYARELLDSKISRQSLKVMKKMAKHLSKFDGKELNAIFTRYADNPQKFQELSAKFIDQYSKDLQAFITEYTNFLKAVNDELVEKSREASSENAFIQSTLVTLGRIMTETGTYLPPEMITQTQEYIKKLSKAEMKEENKELKEDRKEETTGKIHKGIFGKFFGASWINHKFNRMLDKWHKNELKDMQENYAQLQEQLQTKKVTPVFLAKFLKHLNTMRANTKIYKQLGHDSRILLSMAEEDAKKAIESVDVFLAMFKNDPHAQQLMQEFQQMQKLHADLYKVMQTDEVDLQRLSAQIKTTVNNFSIYFVNLKRASDRVLQNIRAASQKTPDGMGTQAAPEMAFAR